MTWRYVGLYDFLSIFIATVIATSLLMLSVLLPVDLPLSGFSKGVVLADGIITLFLISGLRVSKRIYAESRGEINKGEERWDYPLEALREIVVNMIVHRDYMASSDSMIKIFDDRIEFFNPGCLMEGLSIKQLVRGNYISAIRNKQIASLFKEAGIIEKYGSGIKRILESMRSYGLPDQLRD